MQLDRIHHVAYRCRDAYETVHWYRDMLNMEFVLAIAEDRVPSTKAPDPYMHVFLDAVKWDMLEEWSRTRRAPRHAAFLHQRELDPQGGTG